MSYNEYILYVYVYIYMASFKHVSRTGKHDSKNVGERVSKTNYFKWKGPRSHSVNPQTLFTCGDTEGQQGNHTRLKVSPETRSQSPEKSTESQRSWGCRTPGRQGRPWAVQSGRLPGGGDGKASWRRGWEPNFE